MTPFARCAVRGAAVTGALWLAVGAAAAQVPPVPTSPETTTTVPATPPPPDDTKPPVPDPANPTAPPPTTAAPGAPPATSGASTTTTTKPAASPTPPPRAVDLPPPTFSIDLSEIEELRRQARGKGPRPAQSDPGFDAALPFGPGATRQGDATVEPVELGVEEGRIARVRSAGAVAGGLIGLVVVGLVLSLLLEARPPSPPRSGC